MSATASGMDFLNSTIGANPGKTAIVMAALVVLVLVLAFYYASCGKSGFMNGSITQYPFTGLHSNWQLGGGDAGWGGPVHRETTAYQAAVYQPWLRPVGLENNICNSGREGFNNVTIHPGATPGCDTGCNPSIPCRGSWDPSATAEAQALATLGSLPHDDVATRNLQGAVNAATDCDTGLSDAMLHDLMHNGGAP